MSSRHGIYKKQLELAVSTSALKHCAQQFLQCQQTLLQKCMLIMSSTLTVQITLHYTAQLHKNCLSFKVINQLIKLFSFCFSPFMFVLCSCYPGLQFPYEHNCCQTHTPFHWQCPLSLLCLSMPCTDLPLCSLFSQFFPQISPHCFICEIVFLIADYQPHCQVHLHHRLLDHLLLSSSTHPPS